MNQRARQSLWLFAIVPLCTAFCLSGGAALTAETAAKSTGSNGASEGAFIAEIVLLLIVGRGLGELLQRFGQPAVMGQLIGGILLGPSLLGWAWPSAYHTIFASGPEQKVMIEAVSQVGILLLLLLTGMETDLKLVRRVGAACISISTTGVLVPFGCGFALAQFLPPTLLPNPDQRVVAGLFLGTALAISSVKIVAMVVREMNFMRRNLGQVIVASAIIEDTIGWIIIAITFGIASQGHIEIVPLATTIILVGLFMAFSLTVGRRIVFFLIRWANDVVRSEYAVVTVILVITGVMAIITDLIGVHTVLGAFVAGILVGESPILSSHIEGQLRGIITAFFMPVFFGVAGLSADLTVLLNPTLALLTAGLVLVASVGKFSGAFLGSKAANLSWREAVAIGCGMNARGSTEVIVAKIGLSMSILSQNLFTMIVTMAVVTTLAMPPMLRWALGRIPLGDEEKERLEREEIDARGVLSRLERLLVVADNGALGRFASYLAGLVGGGSGMPTTVLRAGPSGEASPRRDEQDVQKIKKGAKASAGAVKQEEARPVEKVALTVHDEDMLSPDRVAEEARKGYSMLFVGLARGLTGKGVFTRRFSDLVNAFDGPLCLVVKRPGESKSMPLLDQDKTILVPINGTEISRSAAELAFVIARPHRAQVKALYVARSAKPETASLSHRREEAVLKDIVDLADRYGVTIQTVMQPRGSAGSAIVKEASKGASMVVMGVARRPGLELFFGETAGAVLAACPGPIVLIAGERMIRDAAAQEAHRTGSGDSKGKDQD
jgi:Kef-type K+ transport system membrane component KefB